MLEDKSKFVPFLNKLALFRKLTPVQVEQLVEVFEPVTLASGQRLFAQGEPGDSMYIVVSGKICISHKTERGERELAHLVQGDIFGEESLLYKRPRTATARAEEPTHLFRLSIEQLSAILRQFPHLKPYLVAMVNSRRMARQSRFNWLTPGETIYLMARKHPVYLYYLLVLPILFGWLSVPCLLVALNVGSQFIATLFTVIGVGILILAVLWGIWRWIDWGNDYYIVTNQRVIWIERVIWLYESRQEAPLSTVLTVITQQDQFGRWWEYGDVIVRTFTGQIVMHKVGQPEQLAGFILELQDRAKMALKQAGTEALEREIRMRLGLSPAEGVEKEKEPQKEASAPARPPARPGVLNRLFAHIFDVRYEEKGIIIYRKHWILLLDGVWKPTVLLLLLLVLFTARLVFNVWAFLPFQILILFCLPAGIFLLGWWIYQYIDWSNDLYQLTSDQIIDVYKKPLGQVDRKTANLDSILSLQHTKKGLLGLLLNYGDVIAMVGGTPFTFDGVYDPAGVQQDIFERINRRKQQQKEAEDARERERVAEWMAAYHRQIEAYRRGENRP